MSTSPNNWLGLPALLALPLGSAQQKSTILAVMGDDIGHWNIRAYDRRTERHYPDLERRRS